MLKRLKRLWNLAKKDPKTLEDFMKLSSKEIMNLPEAGDGKAVYISQGTEEEFKEYQNEQKGIKGIFGL